MRIGVGRRARGRWARREIISPRPIPVLRRAAWNTAGGLSRSTLTHGVRYGMGNARTTGQKDGWGAVDEIRTDLRAF